LTGGTVAEKKKEMVILSFIAYQGFWETDPQKIKNLLVETLNLKILKPFIGEQELVWGPALYKGDHFLDVAMMYTVRNKNTPSEYTVVVRGTNPLSIWSWLDENLKIEKQFPWETGTPPAGAKISEATHTALSVLQDLKPAESIPGTGIPINRFLQDIITGGEAKTIYITGHSLGGCTAPTLALWLKDTLKALDEVGLYVYAYAGPSAGNDAFAEYSDSQLAGNCNRYACSYDIAPDWWNVKSLRELYTIYEPEIEPGDLGKYLIHAAINAAEGKRYTQIAVHRKVPGEVNTRINDYLDQAIYQHVFPYLYLAVEKGNEAGHVVKAVGLDKLLDDSPLILYKDGLY
jgi:hypothetical protein